MRPAHPTATATIYAESILSTKPDTGVAGTLGVVFDDRRDFLGIGLWDPESPIRLRLLHTGTPVPVDAAFWQGRIDDALAVRASIGPDTTAYRLVNGENDGFGGVIIDRYDDVLVVKVYTAAWFPHLRPIIEAAVSATQARAVVVRLSRLVAGLPDDRRFGLTDGSIVMGKIDGEIEFLENGLLLGRVDEPARRHEVLRLDRPPGTGRQRPDERALRGGRAARPDSRRHRPALPR